MEFGYSGARKIFPFRKEMTSYLALGMELLSEDHPNPPPASHQLIDDGGEKARLTWKSQETSLEVGLPVHPRPHP